MGIYSRNLGITVTRLEGNGTGDFYVIRHTDYRSQGSTDYSLELPLLMPTNAGVVGTGILTLAGRDSKMIVTNYDVHGTKILYSTAEILTHLRFGDKTVLVVYSGGSTEKNEMAIITVAPITYHGDAKKFVNITSTNSTHTISFTTSPGQVWIVEFSGFFVHIMGNCYYPKLYLDTMLTKAGRRPKHGIQILAYGCLGDKLVIVD